MSKEAWGIKDNSQKQVSWRFEIATITKTPYQGNKQGSSHREPRVTSSPLVQDTTVIKLALENTLKR